MDGQGIRRKTLKKKFNNGNPSIKSTRQIRSQEETTPPKKKKKKANNQQKLGEDHMQKGLMVMK